MRGQFGQDQEVEGESSIPRRDFFIDGRKPNGFLGDRTREGAPMATKPAKGTRKKTSTVRDLAARKNPKGGAQKKERPGLIPNTRDGGIHKPGEVRLS